MPEARTLRFNNVSELIADVERLKRGCVSAKNWSLPQTAWHCGTALKALQPVPPGTQSTPEQIEQKKARIDPLLARAKCRPACRRRRVPIRELKRRRWMIRPSMISSPGFSGSIKRVSRRWPSIDLA